MPPPAPDPHTAGVYRVVTLTSVPLELSVLQADAESDRGGDGDFIAARSGDSSAFVRLVRHHQARVYSLALDHGENRCGRYEHR